MDSDGVSVESPCVYLNIIRTTLLGCHKLSDCKS